MIELTPEVESKIVALKPEWGVITFMLKKEGEENRLGKICKCGYYTAGRGWMSTTMEVNNGYHEVYLLCPKCDSTEYCSTYMPGEGNEDKGFVRPHSERQYHNDITVINL